MKIPYKNIFQIIPSSFFFFSKLSFLSFFIIVHSRTVANMDASHPWQVGFQDPATPIMEGIIFFNGLLMTFMIFIACLVGWLLYKSLTLFNESVHSNPVGFTHSTLLEVVWTIIPAAILMIISIPSYNLLYAMDEVIDPSLTIKVVGHQWYWSYECSDFEVAPQFQKVYSPELEDARKSLKIMTLVLEKASKEVEEGVTQTQLSIAKEISKFIDEEITEDLSRNASLLLAGRINFITEMLQYEEVKKVSYNGPNTIKRESAEFRSLLSSVNDDLNKIQLITEQKEAVTKLLRTFKQYLRITEEDKLNELPKSIIKDLTLSSDNSLSEKEGSSDSKNFGSDDDSDSDGSVVSDLTYYDKSNSNWDWCEFLAVKKKYEIDDSTLTRKGSDALTSEKICNSAALFPEENDTPFIELVDNMSRDLRELNRFIPIANLSEDKLIDTQLIDHQLRLTRAEREGYSSKYALDTAIVIDTFVNREYNTALDELNNAKYYSHWANIELAAAKVNKLTAEYLQADASLGVTDPLFVRSVWINQKGYYSWSRFLRLAIKKLSDEERLVFLKADEKLNGANSLLGKAQRNLSAEELIRSNSIADNAKAQFLAMEREVVPAVEEFNRGKIILANAEAELKSFQEISDRAATRLENAENAFKKVKPVADRAKARLNAVKSVYNTAQLNLTGIDNSPKPINGNIILEEAQNNFEIIKNNFDQALTNLYNSKKELNVAEERLKEVNVNLDKTKRLFEDTGLLEIQTPVEGKPIEYYPNHLWEAHNEDYEFVKAQLITDTAELEAAKASVNLAEANLSSIGAQLLESELNKSKALIEVLKLNEDNLDALNNEIKHISSIELGIADVIYTKALDNFEKEGSKISELILRRAEKGLIDAKINGTKGYLDLFLKTNFDSLNSNKLISDYADMCLLSAHEELIDAEKDYEKASRLLNKSKKILEKVTFDLSKDYDNPYLETLRDLHKNIGLSLNNSIEQLRLTEIEFSPLKIRLEPGVIQSKSYKEVVLAKAELANTKWLAARVAKTLDIPLCEEAKPFNVQFSHLNTENSSNLVNENLKDNTSSFGEEDSSSDDSSDKIPSKSEKEIKEILSKLDDIEISYNAEGFKKKIVTIFSELSKTLDNTKIDSILTLLDKSLNSMAEEEVEINSYLRRQIGHLKGELDYFKMKEEQEVEPINFDSYLIADEDLVIPEVFGTGKAGKVFRLLEVDNRLFVPTNTHIRLLVTSADVLHSWAVPSLGIKVDACPGRLNQVFLFVKREGVFYGQCSELCGVNHGFMPIVVQAVSQDEYLTWVGKRLCS
uniref:cytochrome c oxidase subunit 2 n=1 Tax=Colpomenia sinuosa TaxID=87236 RepID=UPI0030010AB9|nr:cytochrome c oxidase subunit 2 [Colpomenia sinuosa]